MIVNRHWIALLIAGGLCGVPSAGAQEESGGAAPSSGSSGAGASSSFGAGESSSFGSGSSVFDSGTSSGSSSPFGSLFDSGTTPSTSTAAPNVFGTNPTGTAPPASGTPEAASTFGSGADVGSPSAPREAAPSFTLPGAYGQSAQSFTLGEGRLARPRFEFSTSLTMGYDDNTLQTPTAGIPPIRGIELVSEPVPAQIVEEPVFTTRFITVNGIPVPVTTQTGTIQRVIPGKDAVFREVEISPGQERVGSFFSRASAAFQTQFSSRRTIFTLDLRGNADYYFSRPNDQVDLTGSVSANFLHRITPRMQFSASASLSYLSQPDVRLINGPSRNVGDYFVATSKFDLSYRWARRFSTVTSFSFNSLLYSQKTQQGGNYYEGILGTEGRYAWSPRLTVLADVRYGQIAYPDNPILDSHTIYLLIGGEYAFSPRISTSLRLGESFRTFDEAGGSSATPYLEGTASWRYSPTGFLSLNTRFGFEESGSAETEMFAWRTGMSAVHAFSARLRGSAGLTFVHRNSTAEASNTDFTEQTFDVNVGLEYAFSKRLSFNASYVFTTNISDFEVNDYYRNRFFLGGQYAF